MFVRALELSAGIRIKADVSFDLTPEEVYFRSVCRLSKQTLHLTPQGVSPKAVLFVRFVVTLRLGGCKSA